MGKIIDSEGIRKDPSKAEAITDMTEPLDIESLKPFLGLANQLMKVCPNLAEKAKPLRRRVLWYGAQLNEKPFNS